MSNTNDKNWEDGSIGDSGLVNQSAPPKTPVIPGKEEEGPAVLKNDDGHTPPPAVDPFDPMNLGISTDYAAAINARSSTKAFELRKPNDQEYVRTSPRNDHHLAVCAIIDKQDMSRVYIVS